LRLGLYFGNSPEFWVNLQARYDLKMADKELSAADRKRIRSSGLREGDDTALVTHCPESDRGRQDAI
jgi:plasmid maintenance system antidote protein VapI